MKEYMISNVVSLNYKATYLLFPCIKAYVLHYGDAGRGIIYELMQLRRVMDVSGSYT